MFFFVNTETQKGGLKEENLHPLPDTGRNLGKRDEEKTEVLNAFFASDFSSKTSCCLDTHPPDLVEGMGSRMWPS